MGAPALAGRVAAADYRVTLAPDPDAQSLSAAVRRVLDAKTLPRERQKGSAFRSYDLRPLLLDVQIADAGPPVILRFRGRIHPELGSGRPEEILAAIGDEVGVDLDAVLLSAGLDDCVHGSSETWAAVARGDRDSGQGNTPGSAEA